MKNKIKQALDEKRGLNRVKVGPSNEFNAKVSNGKTVITCMVEDFHFEGIKVLFPKDSDFCLENNTVDFLELNYGITLITRIEKPVVIRFKAGAYLTLKFESSNEVRGVRGKNRLNIKPNFKPILMAKDPLKINSLITFNLINLTSHGLLLETSLSNKHLIAGLKLEVVTLVLPGVGILDIGIKIIFAKRKEGALQVGVSLVNTKEQNLQALARFAIFGTLPVADGRISSKFNQIKDSVGFLRKLESSLRVETVSSAQDYFSVLQIRYEAYLDANKISDTSSVEQMADEYDEHSIIIVGKVDGVVVATFRMVESKGAQEKFPFEEYIPFSALDKAENRSKYYEVSRLAIDPKFQGTDILVRLFRENGRQTAINRKTNICLSTRSLRKNYLQLGFKVVSKEVPHPVLKNEFLALMYVDPERFLAGKGMSVKAWDLVVKDVVDNLAFAGIVPKPSKQLTRYFLRKIENLILSASKSVRSGRVILKRG